MTKKILIVDDHNEFRATLRTYILGQILDIDVFEAISGEDGIAAALNKKPNVILMDYRLPKINGLEASKQIKNSLCNCKIILISMFEINKSKKKFMQYGVDKFIMKNSFDVKLIPLLKKFLNI